MDENNKDSSLLEKIEELEQQDLLLQEALSKKLQMQTHRTNSIKVSGIILLGIGSLVALYLYLMKK